MGAARLLIADSQGGVSCGAYVDFIQEEAFMVLCNLQTRLYAHIRRGTAAEWWLDHRKEMYKFAHQATRKSFTSGVSDKNGDIWLIYRTLCDLESKTSREIKDFFKNGGVLLATSSGRHAARKARRDMREMKAEKAERKVDKEKVDKEKEKAEEDKEKGPDNNRLSPKPVHWEKSVQDTPDATMGAPAPALASRPAGDRKCDILLSHPYPCNSQVEVTRVFTCLESGLLDAIRHGTAPEWWEQHSERMYPFAKEACQKAFTAEVDAEWFITETLADLRWRDNDYVKAFFEDGEHQLATSSGRTAAQEAKKRFTVRRVRVKVESIHKAQMEHREGGNGMFMDVGGPPASPVGLPTSIVKARSKEQVEEVEEKVTVIPVKINRAMAVNRGRPLSGPEKIAEPRMRARANERQFTTSRICIANEAGRDKERLKMEHDAKVKADELKKAEMSSKIIGILGSAQAGSSSGSVCESDVFLDQPRPLRYPCNSQAEVTAMWTHLEARLLAHIRNGTAVDWFRRHRTDMYMFAKEACRKSFTVEMNTDWLVVATLADLQGEGDRQVCTFFADGESRLATPRGRRAAREAEERKKVEEEANAKGTNEVLKGGGGGPSVTPIGLPISTARTHPNQQARRAEEKKEVTPATQNRAKVPAIFGDSSAQCEDPSERKPYGKARAGSFIPVSEARGQDGATKKSGRHVPRHTVGLNDPPCSRCVKADVPCEKLASKPHGACQRCRRLKRE
ncbi:hypothetical protein BDN71DRAFT_1452493 [Pleurotus eryngii]|uniref:Uncharacterized protein n=1 Tax=Pleurotus eryngii TaxID=5323 RepID=A0A9P6DDA6_PLEER|nr:hypothetical protein BDN71DRAFT_1452493 [Pleurotus eryngii]